MSSFFTGFGDEICKLAEMAGVRSRSASAFGDMDRELSNRRQPVPAPAPAPAPALRRPAPAPAPAPRMPAPAPKVSAPPVRASSGGNEDILSMGGSGAPIRRVGNKWVEQAKGYKPDKGALRAEKGLAKRKRSEATGILSRIGMKPVRDTGVADNAARKATAKTLSSKMSPEDIVSRYALPRKKGKGMSMAERAAKRITSPKTLADIQGPGPMSYAPGKGPTQSHLYASQSAQGRPTSSGPAAQAKNKAQAAKRSAPVASNKKPASVSGWDWAKKGLWPWGQKQS